MRHSRGFIITIIVMVVVIIGAVVISRLEPRQNRASAPVNAPSSMSPSSDGVPSGAPSDGNKTQIGPNSNEYESTYATAARCEDALDAITYAAFTSRVKAYESNFLSPPSLTRDQAMAGLTTMQYQQEHDSETAQSETSDVTVRILEKSSITCTPESDGSRQVSVLATIETSQKNDAGATVVIVPELTLTNVFYSTWLEDSGTWKATEEH